VRLGDWTICRKSGGVNPQLFGCRRVEWIWRYDERADMTRAEQNPDDDVRAAPRRALG
jgi:hypothetical protein